MELATVIRRRRMVRSFDARPLPPGVLDDLLRLALRAPTAGNTGGTAWVTLEGPAETDVYWAASTTADWRARSPRWQGLSRAPAVAVCLTSPVLYRERYDEPDKAASGLGQRRGSPWEPGTGAVPGETQTALWPVPYWFGDAACSMMSLLLAATDVGVDACFLGNFRGEQALLDVLGVPAGWRLYGAVVLGYGDGTDRPSRSLARPRPPLSERLHRTRWGAG